MEAKVKLLIVDDHPLFVDGFLAMVGRLRPDWTMKTAPTGAQALALLSEHYVNAAIIDVFLPDRDGFDLMHEVAERWPGLPLILVSGKDHAAMNVRAQASCAQGFIPKTMPAPRFVEMIEAVLAGGSAFAFGERPSALPALTERQAQILDLLADGHGNKEIRYRLGIAERTVRAHLTELFAALGVHSRMQALIRARELGLIG
jgi:DNA-binding NarL/FixJ family response regulator